MHECYASLVAAFRARYGRDLEWNRRVRAAAASEDAESALWPELAAARAVAAEFPLVKAEADALHDAYVRAQSAPLGLPPYVGHYRALARH